jgi:hypothetical protein
LINKLFVCFSVPKHDILHNKLNSAIQEVSNYYGMLEEREKQALRSAMIEERSRFCTLFTLLKPVMVNRRAKNKLKKFIQLVVPNAGKNHLKDFIQFPFGCYIFLFLFPLIICSD